MELLMKRGLRFVAAIVIVLLPVATHAHSGCSTSSLNGSYGFVGTGFVPQKQQSTVTFDPISQVGLVSYDGNGKLSLALRTQYHGKTATAKLVGDYDIANDCTGSVRFLNSAGAVAMEWNFVVVTKGEQIETVGLVAGNSTRPMYSIVFSQKKS